MITVSGWENYQQKKERIQKEATELVSRGHKLALGKKTSNLFRNRPVASRRLDVTDLNQVITIDPDNLVAEVEGMTTFEELVDQTLKHGLLPTVVPELKSITIGGAVTGIGIESSSFRYGLVHETVQEMDVLLGTGEVITANPHNEHAQLFSAYPNTYGALGYALRVKVKLYKAKPYVKLTHLHFNSPEACFEKLKSVCEANKQGGEVDFVDGVAFAPDNVHLTLGQLVDEVPEVSNYKFLNIYYRSIPQRRTDYLTTLDYIWRWDPDWFWCSKNFGMQSFLPRLLLGKWLLKSTAYWKIMRWARNSRIFKWLERPNKNPRETIIQDIEVPIEQASEFYHFFDKEIGITPVWICPLQAYNSQQRFINYDIDPVRVFVNFGFWDNIPSTQPKGYYNKRIEQKLFELNGHKSLYSDVYYTEDEFWQIYDQKRYQTLKAQYDPKQGLKDWYQKVTEKG